MPMLLFQVAVLAAVNRCLPLLRAGQLSSGAHVCLNLAQSLLPGLEEHGEVEGAVDGEGKERARDDALGVVCQSGLCHTHHVVVLLRLLESFRGSVSPDV